MAHLASALPPPAATGRCLGHRFKSSLQFRCVYGVIWGETHWVGLGFSHMCPTAFPISEVAQIHSPAHTALAASSVSSCCAFLGIRSQSCGITDTHRPALIMLHVMVPALRSLNALINNELILLARSICKQHVSKMVTSTSVEATIDNYKLQLKAIYCSAGLCSSV